MPTNWNRNRLTTRLGIDYPIVQGPFGGLPSQKLTAAVSNVGGLGSFGGLGLAPDAIRDAIAEIRSLTSKPFVVNLWVSVEDSDAHASDERAFNRSLEALAPHFDALGVPRPTYAPSAPVRFEDQVRVLIEEKVPAFSFIFGIPPKDILDECRAHGIVIIGAATTPDEAAALNDAGVDVIVASGFEAGGHRGSFQRTSEDSLYGTLSLVPQIVDHVSVPVIAAGGIADARGVIAAFALGAEGVQIGTALLACEESGASRLHRDTLINKRAGHTGLTKGFTGRLARGIHSTLMDDVNRPDADILPYPLQRALVKRLATAAEAAGRADLVPLWAGQSANLSASTDAPAFLRKLVADVSAMAGSVMDWSAKYRQALLTFFAILALGAGVEAHGVSSKDARYLLSLQGPAIVPLMYLGAKHMVTGYDHLAFLVGVIFFLYRMKDILLYVSLFTIGHSLTLLVGALSGLHASSYLVDAVIGVSVIYKAFENMGGFAALRFQPDTRVAVFGFGLVHGFGLATKLQEYSLSRNGLVTNIVSFNGGVEIGQFLALTAVLLALGYWRTRPGFVRHAYAANALLMTVGFLLTGYQLTGYFVVGQ